MWSLDIHKTILFFSLNVMYMYMFSMDSKDKVFPYLYQSLGLTLTVLLTYYYKNAVDWKLASSLIENGEQKKSKLKTSFLHMTRKRIAWTKYEKNSLLKQQEEQLIKKISGKRP